MLVPLSVGTVIFVLALAVVLIAIGVASVVLGCIDQRRLFWAVEARVYWQPEASEPSEQMYGFRRAVFLFAGILTIMFGVLAVDAHESSIADEMEVRSATESAARSLSTSWTDEFGPYSSDVEAAVREANPNLRITEHGDDRYEVTNSRAQHPVCLVVRSRAPPASSAPTCAMAGAERARSRAVPPPGPVRSRRSGPVHWT